MFRNYVKIALRHMWRSKAYTFINIGGLAISLAAFTIIFLYVRDELQYDQYHEKSERIYRLNCRYYLPNDAGFEDYAAVGPSVGPQVEPDYPEIEKTVRFKKFDRELIQLSSSPDKFYEDIVFADSTALQVFNYQFLHGDAKRALDGPFQLVVSASAANKYFGRENVVGETMRMPNDSSTFRISGVIADIPDQSHMRFDFLASVSSLRALGVRMTGNWWNFSYHTFFLLKPDVDLKAFQEKIRSISRRYIPQQEDGSGYRQEYSLTNLKRIHLESHLRGEFSANGRLSNVIIFMIVGILILLIACVNVVNLWTARSMIRAREVGLRKVIGARRNELMQQFLGESILLVVVAALFAVGIAELSLSWINTITQKHLSMTVFLQPTMIVSALTFLLLMGLAAGFYPAVFLAGFHALSMVKGGFRSSRKGRHLRRTLVILQFVISIGLIAGIGVIHEQMEYMRRADLGFAGDQVVVMETQDDPQTRVAYSVLKEEALNLPGVKMTSLSSDVPGKELGNNVVRLGWGEDAPWNDMRFLRADYDFFELFGIELVAGRFFNRSYPSDENEAFLLNESGVRRLGFSSPEDALDKPLKWQNKKGRVIGVIKDFHWRSLQHEIEPFIVVLQTSHASHLSIKVDAATWPETKTALEALFARVMPDRKFGYIFLNDDFERQYRSEERFQEIFLVFTILALMVACLGLFGLTAFSAEQRTKEIGVRKILGASTSNIVVLFSKEFVVMVVTAGALAIPLSYLAMNRWLQEFAYRTEISPLLFLGAISMALMLALCTVSFLAFRSARMNPAEALRYE